jgi:hypothetical protein
MTNFITENQFVKSVMAVWGEDYVYDLIDRGYSPVLTDNGWYWLLTTANRVDKSSDLCYADGAAFYSR